MTTMSVKETECTKWKGKIQLKKKKNYMWMGEKYKQRKVDRVNFFFLEWQKKQTKETKRKNSCNFVSLSAKEKRQTRGMIRVKCGE